MKMWQVMWIIILFIVAVAMLWVMKSAIFVGDTVVERKVFEQSYQRQAGIEESIATYEAQLVMIRTKLANPDLTEQERNTLKANEASIEIQLQTARAQKGN